MEDSSWMNKLPLIFRIKGGVVLKIWPQVIFGILYSALIVSFNTYVPGMSMKFPMTLVTVLGLVIGLLLVFRTNTAYDRYWEGRRIWSNMTHHIRVLTRCCWLGIKEDGTPKDLIQKISAVNLLVAFAYATKNYLREEYFYDNDEEIKELIDHFPKWKKQSSTTAKHQNYASKTDRINTVNTTNSNTSNGSRVTMVDVPKSDGDLDAPQRLNLRKKKTMSTRRKSAAEITPNKRRDSSYHAHDYVTDTNIPLELIYCFTSYIYCVMRREMVDGTTTFVFMGSVNNLMDCLTQFERILRTPIPLAYSVHLHQSIWLYLLSLPFQLVGQLGWFTVPAMGVVCFALLGILAIGWEIENPFGYDDNDLPLDDFCDVIRQEVQTIVGHKQPDPDSWMFSPQNHPFLPASFQSASELNDKSIEELRDILTHRISLNYA